MGEDGVLCSGVSTVLCCWAMSIASCLGKSWLQVLGLPKEGRSSVSGSHELRKAWPSGDELRSPCPDPHEDVAGVPHLFEQGQFHSSSYQVTWTRWLSTPSTGDRHI